MSYSKSDLESYLRKKRLAWRTDATNRRLSFRRNWLRHAIFPELDRRFSGFMKRIAQTADLLQGENQFWAHFFATEQQRFLSPFKGGRLLDFKRLLSYSHAAQRRFLRQVVGTSLLSFEAVEAWRQWMLKPPTNGRFWPLRHGWVVERLSRSKGAASSALFLIRRLSDQSFKKNRR